MKQVWKILNSIINKKKSCPVEFDFMFNGQSTTDPKIIVKEFNDFFVNIGPNLANKINNSNVDFSSYLRNPQADTFFLFPTDRNEIISTAKLLSCKKSSGCDEIPVDLMIKSIEHIAEPLAEIVNLSFITGKVPNLLKIAKICPIHKGGAKNEFNSYRPISVLPSFSKIYEKLVYNRLSQYLTQFNILSATQYGFRSKHSTSMALLDFYDKISKAVDDKKYAVGVFIDLKKAFDTIDHDILLKKMYHYGIRGVSLNWFKSYLTNRFQFVHLNDVCSDYKQITCGVPQGSVLGPLLFLLYINDITNCSDILHFILFADDTNLLHSDCSLDNLISVVNSELDKLSCWFKANKLSLNLEKTNFIMFGNKYVDISKCIDHVKIDGCNIVQVKSVKFLGIFLDEKLNWQAHISKVSSAISRNIGIIYKARDKLPVDALLTLYNCMILPHLSYCCIVWGNTYQNNLDCLVKLQKKAMRVISKSLYRAHADPLFYKFCKLKISDICKLQIASFMYKSRHPATTTANHAFCCKFNFRPTTRQYDTRRSLHELFIPFFRTDIRKKSIACSGPLLWNSLSPCLVNNSSFFSFKKQYLHCLLNQYVQ